MWLHHSYITVLEDAQPEKEQGTSNTTDIPSDNTDAQPKEELPGTSSKTDNTKRKQKVLRQNFPSMGKIYIYMLEKFVQSNTDQHLQETCKKVTSFAGLWYKSKFFTYYRQVPNSIFVRYITPGKSEVSQYPLELRITDVVELDGDKDNLAIGSLYKMRAQYPIVDTIGHLKQHNSENKWLVFIQVSLQRYKDH